MKYFFSLFLFVFASSVYGDSGGYYFGSGIGDWNYEETAVPDFSIKSLEGRVGYSFSKFVSVEGRLGLGVDDYSFTQAELTRSIKIDNYESFYLKPQYKIDNVTLYGLLGYTKAKVKSQEETELQVILNIVNHME